MYAYLDFAFLFLLLDNHVVCKQGLMVDLVKITVILNLQDPRNVKQLCETLGHTGYHRKFIKAYAQIVSSMEKIIEERRDVLFG